MTYAQATDYLFQQLPMYSRIGAAAYKEDLTNITALCAVLGDPHKKFKSIHIGGTDGKGSVSHMLAAILQTAGYKTGLYTSPHLYDFRERIKINGSALSEENVIDWVQKLQPHIQKIKPSFFEVTVAMAFAHFDMEGVDVAVIEVGLGGRLDSTNIITPLLSVITNISYDHQAILGDTLAAIAKEKAGIIKRCIPVVVGERGAETDDVFLTRAAECDAPLVFAQDVFTTTTTHLTTDRLTVTIADEKGLNKKFDLDLTGIYQQKNLTTVLAALQQLKNHFTIADEIVESALASVKSLTGLGGRWEVLQHNPAVILDVAHNRGGILALLPMLQQKTYQQLHIVYGSAKDKDYVDVLKLLPQTATYYFTQAAIPRALSAADLVSAAAAVERYGAAFQNVNEALKAALAAASAQDAILVCGSIFLIAEVDKNLCKLQTA